MCKGAFSAIFTPKLTAFPNSNQSNYDLRALYMIRFVQVTLSRLMEK